MVFRRAEIDNPQPFNGCAYNLSKYLQNETLQRFKITGGLTLQIQ
jgi:hypothetical protein